MSTGNKSYKKSTHKRDLIYRLYLFYFVLFIDVYYSFAYWSTFVIIPWQFDILIALIFYLKLHRVIYHLNISL